MKKPLPHSNQTIQARAAASQRLLFFHFIAFRLRQCFVGGARFSSSWIFSIMACDENGFGNT